MPRSVDGDESLASRVHTRPLYDQMLEDRIVAMRELLASLSPPSDGEALKLLRASYPDAPLVERVRATARWRG